jgi:hypothetical protein
MPSDDKVPVKLSLPLVRLIPFSPWPPLTRRRNSSRTSSIPSAMKTSWLC